jgi:ABC-2 type transport system ATP-binding protein
MLKCRLIIHVTISLFKVSYRILEAMETVIDCRKLTKQYRGTNLPALKDLNLQIAKGEVYGLLGANGAGKSTTIRTLLGFIKPSAGIAKIVGQDIVRESVAIKRHVGYLAGEIALYPQMTGKQLFAFLDDLQPPRSREFQQQLIERFGAQLDQPIHTLSKGNRQKLGLIQSLMHQPDVYILDEPTSGLDPLMQEVFFALVNEERQRGATFLISSHNFSEVQRMCDRVGFIRSGELVAERSLAELGQKAAHSFRFTFAKKAPVAALQKLENIQLTDHDTTHATVLVDNDFSALFTLLAKHQVTAMEQQNLDLEDIFLDMYSKEPAK